MITEKQIETLVAEWLKETGKFLVALKIKPGNNIHIFIDGDSAVTITDCAKLTRFIELRLDRDAEDYELQVSSCGADQPLIMPRQYFKHEGRMLKVMTRDQQQVKGMLEKCTLDGIFIKVDADKKKKVPETTVFIAFSDITESKIEISFKKIK